MRSLLLLVLLWSTASLAAPRLLDPQTLDDTAASLDPAGGHLVLADAHGAVPIGAPRPFTPAAPVAHASADLFLLGLGLAGGGLVLGGAGFAVLYACGAGCSDGITALGWVLAAPGIIPLTVGLIMMYGASGGRARVEAPKRGTLERWAFGLAPLREGAAFTAATVF